AVLTRAVRARTVGIVVAAISIGALLVLGMAAYAEVDLDVYRNLPEAMRSVMGIPADADAASLAYNVMLGTMAALTLAGLAVSIGAGAIAGEERDGENQGQDRGRPERVLDHEYADQDVQHADQGGDEEPPPRPDEEGADHLDGPAHEQHDPEYEDRGQGGGDAVRDGPESDDHDPDPEGHEPGPAAVQALGLGLVGGEKQLFDSTVHDVVPPRCHDVFVTSYRRLPAGPESEREAEQILVMPRDGLQLRLLGRGERASVVPRRFGRR
ncbi:MAG: hypothetical protein ABGY75_01380, partial [Gemmataceae bacterium]